MLGAVIPCLLMGCISTNRSTTSEEQAKYIEDGIRELKRGTSRAAVENLLDAHYVEHGWAAGDKTMYATIRNIGANKSPVVTKNVSIVFTFDPEEKLIETKMETVLTGP